MNSNLGIRRTETTRAKQSQQPGSSVQLAGKGFKRVHMGAPYSCHSVSYVDA